jgi:hypothetical protein
MFLAGWNDGSQGPLLPSLQEYYNVSGEWAIHGDLHADGK